jgi:hypothetical protein
MRTLKPLFGGDTHHQRVMLLQQLAANTAMTYERYAEGAPGQPNVYVLHHLDYGDILLTQTSVELFTAGYCAGLLARHHFAAQTIADMIPGPVDKQQARGYYVPGDGTLPASWATNTGRITGNRLLLVSVPDFGQLMMRKDHAPMFYAGFIAASVLSGTAALSNILKLLQDLTRPTPTPPEGNSP